MAKRRFENISKHLRVSFIVTAILLNTAGIAKAYEIKTNDVEVVIDGENASYKTTAQTVKELFEKENIEIGNLDNISVDLDDEIVDDMRILINKAVEVKVVVDNKSEETIETGEITVGRFLLQYKKDKGENFVLAENINPSEELKNNMIIKLNSIREETSVTTESIPFETTTVENNKMAQGSTNVVTKGEEGSRQITSKTTYIGGEVDSVEVVEDVVIKEPVNEVIEKGVAKVIETNAGTYLSNKVMKMRATAYTASRSCTGKGPGDPGYGITASGMKAAVGVVAVDKNVIPLGTKLYIEGYGFAIAGDTGGAIKGNKVDLFYNNYSEAINFGVQYRDVYVLDEKIG